MEQVFTYNPIAMRRQVMESHRANAEMNQKAVDFYSAKRGKKNAEAAERFRARVRMFNSLYLEVRDELADMIDAEAMKND